MEATSVSRRSLFQYSLLALPLAFASLPLYIHGPDFYTRELGLSLGVIGSLLLLIRLFDACQDPLIGYMADRYQQHRLALICAGTLLLVIGMAAVFYGPPASVSLAGWFAMAMILATTGFSIVSINLTLIGGLWSADPQQRTRISAWRESFALLGLLTASILPAVLQSHWPTATAFQMLFWLFAALVLLAFVLFSRFSLQTFCPNKTPTIRPQYPWGFLNNLSGADRHFFGVCFLSQLASAIPGVLVLFFIHDYLGASQLTGVFLLLYFSAGAALMALWVKLAKQIGKRLAWLSAMLLAVLTFIGCYWLPPGDSQAGNTLVTYGIICILAGSALGADLALPPAILADRISQQQKQGVATQYYALLAFIAKAAIAIASGLALLLLDRAGFVAGTNNSAAALQQLITLYALLPCLLKVIAAGYLWRRLSD